ncbi:MAG: hypothetical protein ACTSRK_07770 [Promethearchaeota archaeon]
MSLTQDIDILNNLGLHHRRISRELGVILNTLRYHLNFLEKKGILTTSESQNKKTYFLMDKVDSRDKKLITILQQQIYRSIIS